MNYRAWMIMAAIVGFSTIGSAEGCSAGKCAAPPASGERPLKMEPKDSCKGTVKCVNQSKYPNGSKTEVTVETPAGDKKVIMQQPGSTPVQPGDHVEITGRQVEVNGDSVMMGEQLNRAGTSNNLNSSVQMPSSSGK